MPPGRRVKRLLPAALLAALALPAGGCRLWDLLRLGAGPKTLSVELDKVAFRGLEGRSLRFEVPLRLRNQSRGQAQLRELRLEARLNGRPVLSFSRPEPLCIAPEAEQVVVVPAYVDAVGAAEAAAAGEGTLSFSGSVVADLGVLGERTVAFRSEPLRFSRDYPRLVLESVSLAKSRPSELRLTAAFRRAARAGDELPGACISGEAFVNGIRVAALDRCAAGESGDRVEVELAVPTGAALRAAASLLGARSCRVRLAVVFEAETGTMRYRVPYVFEREDVPLRRGAGAD